MRRGHNKGRRTALPATYVGPGLRVELEEFVSPTRPEPFSGYHAGWGSLLLALSVFLTF